MSYSSGSFTKVSKTNVAASELLNGVTIVSNAIPPVVAVVATSTVVTVVSADIALSSNQLAAMANPGIFLIDGTGITSGTGLNLTFGDDTSDNAVKLLNIFGITDSQPSRLVRVSAVGGGYGARTISIGNTSNPDTSTNVQFQNVGDISVSYTTQLSSASATRDGFILVTVGTPTVSTEYAILFTVIGQQF